jgi:hypothetical protein
VTSSTRQSGKLRSVGFRWACDKQLRDAVTDFAGDSRRANPWAADLYDRLVEAAQVADRQIVGRLRLTYVQQVLDQQPERRTQSPIWFCRTTVWPSHSSSRTAASPMIVDRGCPTCISLAAFGAE